MTYAIHPCTPKTVTQNPQNEFLKRDGEIRKPRITTVRFSILSILSMYFGVGMGVAGMPAPHAVTAFDRIKLHLPMHLFGECKGTPGGYQVEGEFGVEVSLVSNWLLGGYEGQPGITDSGLVQMGGSIP